MSIGLAVDIGGSIAATLLLAIVYGIVLGATGASQEQIEAATGSDSWLFYAGMAVGCGFSALGGYVCARMARHSEYRLGGILAAISVVIGALLTSSDYPVQLSIAMAVAGVAAVMLGTRFGYVRNRGG